MSLIAFEVPWNAILVGLGAFLAGFGSLLSGIAAYRLATRSGRDEEREAGEPDR